MHSAKICRGIVFSVWLIGLSAQAGLYVEPAVGYTAGSLSQSGVPALSTHAFIFGGRLGYRLDEYRFGLDYSMGLGSGSQLGNSGSYRPTDLGIFGGYELPFMLEAYASIFVKSKAKIQSSENPADFSGQSYRLGLGWKGLPFCTVILEAIYRHYSKYDGTNLTKSITGTTLGASVSVPLP